MSDLSGDRLKACTCHADIETRLTARFETVAPDATGHKVRLQGYTTEQALMLRQWARYQHADAMLRARATATGKP